MLLERNAQAGQGHMYGATLILFTKLQQDS